MRSWVHVPPRDKGGPAYGQNDSTVYHQVTVTGLQPGKKYKAEVRSGDGVSLPASAIVTFTAKELDLGSVPRFFCQAAGNYKGGEWGEGLSEKTRLKIKKEGCAITSAAMVLWPKTAVIFDERTDNAQPTPADPYVVFRVNGENVYANWIQISEQFEGITVNSRFIKVSEQQKASMVASTLDSGAFPIKHIPGHFVVVVSHGMLPDSSNQLRGTSKTRPWGAEREGRFIATVRPGDIEPLTDVHWKRQAKEHGPGLAASGVTSIYDKLFFINDPGTRYGENIPFSSNIKNQPFSKVDQIVTFR